MLIKIMRGVSGSGKSTKAKKLIQEYLNENDGDSAIICSADQYFVDPVSGKYEFNPKKLGEAHSFCRGKFKAALELGADLVIVDNTNTKRWEFKPYVEMAKAYECECEEVIVGGLEENDLKVYANRNTHGVPLDAIRKMAKRFEK